MIRRGVAGVILGVALLAGSLAWSGFLALRTVFDADRSREVAQELLDNDAVKAQLVENMADAITGLVPDEVPVSPEVVESAAIRTLDDPAVEALILSAFADTHAAFLGDGDAPERLDLTAAAEAARAAIVGVAPQLDAVVPAAPLLEVPLPTERIPDASPVRDFLERAVPLLAVAALLGVAGALFTTTDRPSVLRRAGRWALGTTAFYLLIGLGLPWVIRQIAPNQAEVIAALLTALLRTTLIPSIVLGVCGAGLIATSMLWPTRSRSRSDERRRPRPVADAPIPSSAPGARTAPDRVHPGAQQPVHRPAQQPVYPGAPPRTYPGAAPNRFPYPDSRADHTRVHPTVGPPPSATSQPPPVAGRAQPARAMPPTSAPASPPRPERAGPPATSQPAAGPSNSVFEPSPVPPPRRPQPDNTMPRLVEGLGWVLDPDDPGPRPAAARWVDGVGYVVPDDAADG